MLMRPLLFLSKMTRPQGLKALLAANKLYRRPPWPRPFDTTTHRLRVGDARDLSWIATGSVHLIVTSPPYWTLKQYAPDRAGQMGDIEDYERFLDELDKVWSECERVLVGGGRICCVVGDVYTSEERGSDIMSCLFMQIFKSDPEIRAGLSYTYNLEQNRKRRYRGRREWCWFLWQAIPAGCYCKERCGVYSVLTQRRNVSFSEQHGESAFHAY